MPLSPHVTKADGNSMIGFFRNAQINDTVLGRSRNGGVELSTHSYSRFEFRVNDAVGIRRVLGCYVNQIAELQGIVVRNSDNSQPLAIHTHGW